MAYLKALGILRLISEQADDEACGWWHNDIFSMRSALDRDALISFIFDKYEPTYVEARTYYAGETNKGEPVEDFLDRLSASDLIEIHEITVEEGFSKNGWLLMRRFRR